MLDLDSLEAVSYTCRNCGTDLLVEGWYVPGMRNLAELHCPDCGRRYYGDLPTANALGKPALLDRETGTAVSVTGRSGWYPDILESSYADRTSTERTLETTRRETIKRPVLVNCLDINYGHCLYKLLSVDTLLDRRPDLDVIVLVQPSVEWLVPDGVSAVWVLDLPLSTGAEWNDWLAEEIRDRLDGYDERYLAPTISLFSPPKPDTYDIRRYTGVETFPLDEWFERFDDLTVTFVWRGLNEYSGIERLWCSSPQDSTGLGTVYGYYNRLNELAGRGAPAVTQQRNRFVTTAERLRDSFPHITCAVAGIGEECTFPSWIEDIRITDPTPERERALCEQYANSHLVVGVHGSNMLLPSAHAGSAISLLLPGRTATAYSDILFREDEQLGSHFRYFTPIKTSSPDTVAELAENVLTRFAHRRSMSVSRPSEDASIEALQDLQARNESVVARFPDRETGSTGLFATYYQRLFE